VLSELDEERQNKLLGMIRGWQSVITTTIVPRGTSAKVITVKGGAIIVGCNR
jgi:recombinational DNA repair ATPase RecF